MIMVHLYILLDGVNFTTCKDMILTEGPRASGTYGEKPSDLDDAQFYIGWMDVMIEQWYRF
jgi:hypothetical protein